MLNVHIDSFGYQDRPVLEDIAFKVEQGGHLALMGESGSGKSTLLKIIYGLLHLEHGSIFWNDQQALGPNFNLVPGEPYMKYLAQDFDLMPFTTVSENIGEHLSVFERESHDQRINDLLKLVELEDYAKTKVKNLSGGQQQRVAIARVLAQEPELLLLDEPFGHIDRFKRTSLRRKLFTYAKNNGITVITASHDPEDVLSFADNTIVMKKGRVLVQQKTKKLYRNPTNYYVASLFGEVNEVPMHLLKSYAKINKSVLIYAHEFQISKKSGLQIEVLQSYFKGSHYLVEGQEQGGATLLFISPKRLKPGDTAFLNVSLETINNRLQVEQGTDTERTSV
nr:ABC transporter ATP-binding protein [Allomuricauda sp.]